jgi:structural toxin protein (hemagglutinin/hemolysin) RtxA
MKLFKIEFYVPETHLEDVKNAVFKAGAGQIGNYDSCCWETEGCGQFRPLENSSPYIGKNMKLEKVKEFKVELVCEEENLENAVNALKQQHPYETPAYQYWKINNQREV